LGICSTFFVDDIKFQQAIAIISLQWGQNRTLLAEMPSNFTSLPQNRIPSVTVGLDRLVVSLPTYTTNNHTPVDINCEVKYTQCDLRTVVTPDGPEDMVFWSNVSTPYGPSNCYLPKETMAACAVCESTGTSTFAIALLVLVTQFFLWRCTSERMSQKTDNRGAKCGALIGTVITSSAYGILMLVYTYKCAKPMKNAFDENIDAIALTNPTIAGTIFTVQPGLLMLAVPGMLQVLIGMLHLLIPVPETYTSVWVGRPEKLPNSGDAALTQASNTGKTSTISFASKAEHTLKV